MACDRRTAKCPVVQVNRRRSDVVSVVVNQRSIVAAAMDHLAALGHRSVAFVRGPAAYWSAGRRDRVVRHLRSTAHASAGGSMRIDMIGPAPATFEGGRAAYEAVERAGSSAVVAFNDLQAAGLLVAAHAAGRSVPDSLSIIGSDGLALAAMTAPPLTTVAAPLDDLGRTARRLLADVLVGRPVPAVTRLEPLLVLGSTTAPPSDADRRARS